MHLALYRKYRPASFDDMCGQEHITSVLKYEVEHGQVSHAYLFCGSRGTGKTSSAKILAKAVNCLSPVNGNPCGKCDACLAIEQGVTTDIVEMDAASNNGVDNIRVLRDEVTYSPAMLKYRVYIIDEVHMLSVSAFNALLKTIEEPPEHVLFILATTEMHKLPVTIISRCQRFDFRRISVSHISSRLKYIADEENITLTDSAAQRIAKAAEGGMRDAISLFELCAGGGAVVDDGTVLSVLGQTDYESVAKVAHAVAQKDIRSIFDSVKSAEESSKDIGVFWQELTSFWRDMLVSKYTPDFAAYLELTAPDAEILTAAASDFSAAELTYGLEVMDETYRMMLQSPQTKRICAEVSLIRLCDVSLDKTMPSLLSRISSVEDRIKLIECGAFSPSPEETPGLTDTVGETAEDADGDDIPVESAVPSAESGTDGGGDVPLSESVLQSVKDKLLGTCPEAASFIVQSSVYVTDGGSTVKVVPSNAVAKMMLDRPTVANSCAKAFLLAGVTESLPRLVVENPKKQNNGGSPLDELI